MQFFKKIRDSLVQADFKSSEADPCLVYKEDQIGVCFKSSEADPCLVYKEDQIGVCIC